VIALAACDADGRIFHANTHDMVVVSSRDWTVKEERLE